MYNNNINGGARNNSFLQSVDFYRRVPTDLTEATNLGAMMSLVCLLMMATLFLSETFAFMRSTVITNIAMDDNLEAQIRLNFNVTMLDLHCDYVSVDVLDALGTNRQNVTKNVEKWQLDETGVRRIFSGRNREVRQLEYEEHDETLEELHENGVSAVVLTQDTFKKFMSLHEIVFINFYAPWCVWCQRLHPTWEKFAERMENEKVPIKVATVDCVDQMQLCRENGVRAFPYLVWFQDGKMVPPNYKQDRTVDALSGFVKRKIDMQDRHRVMQEEGKAKGRIDPFVGRPEHPGCQVSGHLMVNRVPGNFHIEAKSVNHNLNAAMTNLTHIVNHLSFGDPLESRSRKVKRVLKQVPEEHKNFNVMDSNAYQTNQYHQAWHHFIKVVSTHLNMGSTDYDRVTTYQYLEQSQIVHYEETDVPEARFSYDISPMSVIVEREGRRWYDYLTSLCAIIGGTFTTLGLIDSVFYRVFKAKKL